MKIIRSKTSLSNADLFKLSGTVDDAKLIQVDLKKAQQSIDHAFPLLKKTNNNDPVTLQAIKAITDAKTNVAVVLNFITAKITAAQPQNANPSEVARTITDAKTQTQGVAQVATNNAF